MVPSSPHWVSPQGGKKIENKRSNHHKKAPSDFLGYIIIIIIFISFSQEYFFNLSILFFFIIFLIFMYLYLCIWLATNLDVLSQTLDPHHH